MTLAVEAGLQWVFVDGLVVDLEDTCARDIWDEVIAVEDEVVPSLTVLLGGHQELV